MAWFKVDDGFWSHPKTLRLSPRAVSLWVRAGAWSCQQLTDGQIPAYALPMFAASAEDAAELVTVEYWHETADGFVFHDWADYQEPSEKVKERRAAARDRMRTVRANKTRTDAERARERADLFGGSSPNPDPTRPDPTLSTSIEVESAPERALSPFCEKHQPHGPRSGVKCRDCGTARMAFTASQAAERSKPTPLPARDPECREHVGYPLPCHRCAQEAAGEVA